MANPTSTSNELDPDRIAADIATGEQLRYLGEAADKIEEAETKLADAISLLNEAGLCVSDNGRLYEAAEQLGSILKDDIQPARMAYVVAHGWLQESTVMARPTSTSNELDPDRIADGVSTNEQLDYPGEAADKIEEAETKLRDAIEILNAAAMLVSNPDRLIDAAKQLDATLKDDVQPMWRTYVAATLRAKPPSGRPNVGFRSDHVRSTLNTGRQISGR